MKRDQRTQAPAHPFTFQEMKDAILGAALSGDFEAARAILSTLEEDEAGIAHSETLLRTTVRRLGFTDRQVEAALDASAKARGGG